MPVKTNDIDPATSRLVACLPGSLLTSGPCPRWQPGWSSAHLDDGAHTYIHCTMDFEWDPDKAAANLEKHGVDFADAVGVLFDDFALTLDDEHPTEERFITIGADPLNRILVVVYAWRRDTTIRSISARKATTSERRSYEARL